MASAARQEPAPKVELGWAASVPEIDRWLAGAEPGERLVYATGVSIPRHTPAWAYAGLLVQQGEVLTFHKRQADGRTFDHIMERRAIEIVPVAPVAAATVDVDEEDPAFRVLKALRRAANFGLPCPTNDELARGCALSDAGQASYRVRQLAQLGRIRVEQLGPGQRRVVTIVGSGKQTRRDAGRGGA